MISFIDEHRGVFGVEPICRLLPIAPSTYYENVTKRLDVDRLSIRARSDIGLKIEIRRVFEHNFRVYGVRKVWRQLKREGFDVARCSVARLMRSMSLRGIIRGKPIRTTFSDKTAPSPLDRVNRQFKAPAPNRLWVSDFTYVATWQGFVYVAFVIDVFARRIVGWRASRTAHAGFVLDALEQALHDRRPDHGGGLVHHSDRGVQYVSIRYSERLAEAGIEPSVGSVGRQLRQRPRRNDQRSLQGRGHSSTRTMEELRSGRVRYLGMGRLVQPPTTSRANREYTASRS
jgi:transposase InsO family protein